MEFILKSSTGGMDASRAFIPGGSKAILYRRKELNGFRHNQKDNKEKQKRLNDILKILNLGK